MTGVTPIRDLKAYLEPEQVERLVDTATNLRDKLLDSNKFSIYPESKGVYCFRCNRGGDAYARNTDVKRLRAECLAQGP